MDNWGKGTLAIALVAACAPFFILGRTADPGTQAYQDAKGSWVPAAMMNENAIPFWISAAAMLATGVCLIGFDRLMDRRRSKQRLDL